MINFFKLLFCLLLLTPGKKGLQVDKIINADFHEIQADAMGNCYAISDARNLYKLSEEGDTLFTFEDKSFLVSHVDASNPLKVLVYASSQNTIKFLDKTLTPINDPIQIDDLGIPVSNAVATSRDNLFWIFDDSSQELKKYNRSMKEVANSGSLTALTGKNIQPFSMLEAEGKVYVVDSLQGVFQFDHLGTYLFNFKNIHAKKISVMGTKIVFLKDNELYLYDTILLEEQKISLSDSLSAIDFAISRKKMFIMTKENIQVFSKGIR